MHNIFLPLFRSSLNASENFSGLTISVFHSLRCNDSSGVVKGSVLFKGEGEDRNRLSFYIYQLRILEDLLQSELYFIELLEHFQWVFFVVVVVLLIIQSVTVVEAFLHFI